MLLILVRENDKAAQKTNAVSGTAIDSPAANTFIDL